MKSGGDELNKKPCFVPRNHGGPAGMPALSFENKILSFFEFWPGWMFYAPVAVAAFLFMIRFRGITLPTITNPNFSCGGFVGESKNQILTLARRYLGDKIAPFIVYHHKRENVELAADLVQKLMTDARLSFPVVAKPDVACRGAGVQPLYNVRDLKRYISQLTIEADIIIQQMVACEGEAGIFYVREPGQAHGKITSVTLKYFPYVIGDGTSTLETLINRDPRASSLSAIYLPRFKAELNSVPHEGSRVRLAFAGNHSKGTIFRNGNDLVSDKMTTIFDNMSRLIPEFYLGRYDIRFDDFQRIREGYDEFTIVEINGSGAEPTHIWDARTSLWNAWRDVIRQLYLVWKIGAINRRRGYVSMSLAKLWRLYRREKVLIAHYPPTL